MVTTRSLEEKTADLGRYAGSTVLFRGIRIRTLLHILVAYIVMLVSSSSSSSVLLMVCLAGTVVSDETAIWQEGDNYDKDNDIDHDGGTIPPHDVNHNLLDLQDRLYNAKLDLWARGGQGALMDETYYFGPISPESQVDDVDNDDERIQLRVLEQQVLGMEAWQRMAARQGPIQRARYSHWTKNRKDTRDPTTWSLLSSLRGGNEDNDTPDLDNFTATTTTTLEEKIQELSERFGSPFIQAVEQNRLEHARDCEESCEVYYCASKSSSSSSSLSTTLSLKDLEEAGTSIRSYSMGAVPPEDFATDFGFPLDLIKVTQGRPLFSREEVQQVIHAAEEEDGVHKNEFPSGKYRLGGDWLTNLPTTRKWFNIKLETILFPLVASLFPEVITDVSVLRAHSVSLLKYNSSHPRTDVHIDNGILAMTIAMTPQEAYTGGGTFFEHFAVGHNDVGANSTTMTTTANVVLPMDVGHGTFRPGSVRHGGHRVTDGTRYVLGAFLLLEDRVEHVRRLKNRGAELRRAGNLDDAARHFEWALALNPKCTTCLKDWAEILHTQRKFGEAEAMIRQALEWLEYKDSDALFTLGMLLSEQGRDDECIYAYRQSLALNQEDAELWYNLGVKLGEQQQRRDGGSKNGQDEEMRMYAMSTQVDPTFGGSWLNWGTTLAEQGNLDDAEVMFLKAVGCDHPPEVKPKAMVNLALIYHTRAGQALQIHHDLDAGKEAALKAASYLDAAKPLLDAAVVGQSGQASNMAPYLSQHKVLRLATHRNLGQIYGGSGDMARCEAEFRQATVSFPLEVQAWQMLGRALELQGKTEEMQAVIAKLQQLR